VAGGVVINEAGANAKPVLGGALAFLGVTARLLVEDLDYIEFGVIVPRQALSRRKSAYRGHCPSTFITFVVCTLGRRARLGSN